MTCGWVLLLTTGQARCYVLCVVVCGCQAAGQSRTVMRSLLCVEFEVWQIMHPDVFVALILALSRMLNCQVQTGKTQ